MIAALRRHRPVEVSTLDGVVENVEFSLPAELRNVVPASPHAALRAAE